MPAQWNHYRNKEFGFEMQAAKIEELPAAVVRHYDDGHIERDEGGLGDYFVKKSDGHIQIVRGETFEHAFEESPAPPPAEGVLTVQPLVLGPNTSSLV